MAGSPRPARPFHGRIDELRRGLEDAERHCETALRRCELLGARALRARILYEGAVRAAPEALFRREGEFWTIAYAGSTCRLRDVKGLRYLAVLIAAPGRDVHALHLASSVAGIEADLATRPSRCSTTRPATPTAAAWRSWARSSSRCATGAAPRGHA